MRRFNRWLAIHITNAVGTMAAAWIFAAIALVSLPAALATGNLLVIVGWVAQTFLQLVLLAVIMVGQRVQGRETERRDQETHDAVMAELKDVKVLVAMVHRLMRDPGATRARTTR